MNREEQFLQSMKDSTAITLSQSALRSYVTCQRQFQLRYLSDLSWPHGPGDKETSIAGDRGHAFHLALERYFLGLPVHAQDWPDEKLRRWWATFESHAPSLPEGKRMPEQLLTVPAGNGYLSGRFDLFISDETNGQPFAHVYDWKTGRARTAGQLRTDWQTRVYLALLAEGANALRDDGIQPAADRIFITYWYVNDAHNPITVGYNQQEHQRNWPEIVELIEKINDRQPQAVWPLTDDWTPCRRCTFQAYCGRQEAGQQSTNVDSDDLWGGALIDERLVEPHTP